jgi:hypothetical protein
VKAVSIHELKRRLLRRLANQRPAALTAIAEEFREHAVAREFLDGASTSSLTNGAWPICNAMGQADVERAIRRRTKPRMAR